MGLMVLEDGDLLLTSTETFAKTADWTQLARPSCRKLQMWDRLFEFEESWEGHSCLAAFSKPVNSFCLPPHPHPHPPAQLCQTSPEGFAGKNKYF